MGLEAGSDHPPRMGIGGAVQHDHGRFDGGEGGRVHALILQSHHVHPGLMMCARVARLELLVGGDEIVRIQRQQQVAQHAEPLVGIGEFLRQALYASPQTVVHALLADRPQAIARRRIEGAAADEDQRGRATGVGPGVGESQHRAPGMAHEGRPAAPTARFHQLVKVRNVASDGERLTAAAALKRLEHPEPIRKCPGYWCHVPRRARAAV